MAVVGQTRPVAPNVRTANIRTPLFIFGIALALVAFLVMFAFGIVFVSRAQPTGTVPVVVAKDTIPARTPITLDKVGVSQLPAAAVPQGTYLHVSDLNGFAAVVDIYKGQAISSNLVTADPNQIAPSSSTFLPIPKGMVAMTLATSELTGAGGYIAQGDFIDIVAVVNTSEFGAKSGKPVTVTVFQSVWVIRVGPQATLNTQNQKQGVATSITVALTQCDVNYISWLLTSGTLRFTLPSYKDYSAAPPSDNGSCKSTDVGDPIGPSQVNARWHFYTNG